MTETTKDVKALLEIAAIVNILYETDPSKIVEQVRAMRRDHSEICERLREAATQHNLGLGGERLDVLVIDELSRLRAALQQRDTEIKELRIGFWLTHGGEAPYGDDGEMTCCCPRCTAAMKECGGTVDYLRGTPREVSGVVRYMARLLRQRDTEQRAAERAAYVRGWADRRYPETASTPSSPSQTAEKTETQG
jgi:hypothetical protein